MRLRSSPSLAFRLDNNRVLCSVIVIMRARKWGMNGEGMSDRSRNFCQIDGRKIFRIFKERRKAPRFALIVSFFERLDRWRGGRAVVSFRDSCVCVRAETQKLNLRATLVTRFPDFVRLFPGKVFDHSLNGPLVINYRGRAKILCQVFLRFFFFFFF